jgi:hypothetical protein
MDQLKIWDGSTRPMGFTPRLDSDTVMQNWDRLPIATRIIYWCRYPELVPSDPDFIYKVIHMLIYKSDSRLSSPFIDYCFSSRLENIIDACAVQMKHHPNWINRDKKTHQFFMDILLHIDAYQEGSASYYMDRIVKIAGIDSLKSSPALHRKVWYYLSAELMQIGCDRYEDEKAKWMRSQKEKILELFYNDDLSFNKWLKPLKILSGIGFDADKGLDFSRVPKRYFPHINMYGQDFPQFFEGYRGNAPVGPLMSDSTGYVPVLWNILESEFALQFGSIDWNRLKLGLTKKYSYHIHQYIMNVLMLFNGIQWRPGDAKGFANWLLKDSNVGQTQEMLWGIKISDPKFIKHFIEVYIGQSNVKWHVWDTSSRPFVWDYRFGLTT